VSSNVETFEKTKTAVNKIIKMSDPNFQSYNELDNKEISNRLSKLGDFESRIKTGYLKYYIEKVSSASTGAVFS